MNTNKASDIADYIVRTLHAAGENMLAFFKQLAPLETAGEPHPKLKEWPVIFQAPDEGKMNRQAWRDSCEHQMDEADQLLKRTQQPAQRRTIAELLGKKV